MRINQNELNWQGIICGKRQKRHRMDHGTLPGNNPQGQRHQKRFQRLGHRSWKFQVYSGFIVKHYQCECANGGDCGGVAKG